MRYAVLVIAIAVCVPAAADLAAPAAAAVPLDGTPMEGPYATLADVCRAEETDPAVCETPPRDCGRAGRDTPHLAPPFLESRVIQWRGACEVIVRTDAGWWQRKTDSSTAFLHNGERYLSEVDDVDVTRDGALVIRWSYIHWTCPEKMPELPHPAFSEWYECKRSVVVCAVGGSGTPSCAPAVMNGYVTYCRAPDPPYRELHHPLPRRDYRDSLEVSRDEIRIRGTHPARFGLRFR